MTNLMITDKAILSNRHGASCLKTEAESASKHSVIVFMRYTMHKFQWRRLYL